MSEIEKTMPRAREMAAQAWCADSTKDKVMDTELAEAFAEILVKAFYSSNLGCATTGELLSEIRARIEVDGKIDYRTIDG